MVFTLLGTVTTLVEKSQKLLSLLFCASCVALMLGVSRRMHAAKVGGPINAVIGPSQRVMLDQ